MTDTDTKTLTATEESTDGRRVTASYLAVAFDCARPSASPAAIHLDASAVAIGRGAKRAWTREGSTIRIDLPDAWMSSAHASMRARDDGAGGGGWVVEDRGSKNGTFVNGARVERETTLLDRDVIEVGGTVLVYRVVPDVREPSDVTVSERATAAHLPRTVNPAWSEAITTAMRVASSALAVLVLGESGTGKEVLARALHAASGRGGRFVAINCGAIPRTLVESELFGVKKGAFSGAVEDRPGHVRAADGGTLFLDEVAELPDPSQVALLRVIQEQEVVPIGETRVVPVDVRVVAATHADLRTRVAEGRFRADLYARLSGHVVRVPPLRARPEDIGLLVAELLGQIDSERAGRIVLSRAAARAIFAHDWPFNVRELEHALRAAIAIAPADEIGLNHLPEAVREPSRSNEAETAKAAESVEETTADSEERERIVAALAACNGNQTQAARMLGVSRATLVTKLSVHRLPRPRKR